MADRDYIQRPVDEAYRQGIEGMPRGKPSAGDWFNQLAQILAMGLAFRGGVGMPGGIAPKADIREGLRSQVSQGWRPGAGKPFKPYGVDPEVVKSLGSDTFQGPAPTTYVPLNRPRPWTPTHEREGLWDQMLTYLYGTSRQ